ncbi:MAG: hypothetical protein FJZ10_01295 [Candidatus Omnitrophica bacterium]|nr:hypothetical protein [Candidatus Omnitrophota bacterium]
MKKRGIYILWIILLIVFLLLMIKIMPGCNQKTSCVREGFEVIHVPTIVPQQKPSKTRIIERRINSGNAGYFVLDKEYVYFGISKTISEEIPVR